MPSLLETEGLEAAYGWTKVLHGLSFAVEQGGITTILGANGAGKTTTLRAVSGMVKASGTVRFDGKAIAGRPTEEIVRLGIATIGRAIGAYFKKANEKGGINGRKIVYISYDDGYSPPKTVEMVRKLVEQDQVAVVFQPLGTPTNTAIHKYMNRQKVPQLFVATGATKWNDPKNFPCNRSGLGLGRAGENMVVVRGACRTGSV